LSVIPAVMRLTMRDRRAAGEQGGVGAREPARRDRTRPP
jgi:hypothetical protein